MSKYADFVEDFEKWEDEEMNAAETAYYIEVQSRVSKKCLKRHNKKSYKQKRGRYLYGVSTSYFM